MHHGACEVNREGGKRLTRHVLDPKYLVWAPQPPILQMGTQDTET